MESCFRLTNELWCLDIAPDYNGRVARLIDRTAGDAVRAEPPQLAAGVLDEGGGVPFFGLDVWTKAGETEDPNTGVRSAFAPIHGVPLSADAGNDSVRLQSQAHGLALTIHWQLPSGANPLTCRLSLVNQDADPDTFQWEGLFLWTIAGALWPHTAAAIPGVAPMAMEPFGDINFSAGTAAPGECAFWWERDTRNGVALKAGEGIHRFFAGIKSHTFVMGPHSRPIRLARGDRMDAGFAVAPLAWAMTQGWDCDLSAAETRLAEREADLSSMADAAGSLDVWTRSAPPPATPPIPRRALHLTLQYAPSDLRATLELLETVVAPAGYNQLMVEVGRAFPYRSHPAITPDWAWSREQWMTFKRVARDLGLDLIPQYNALGHQGESGLGTAYPELREDGKGWCLCPQHPETIPYLLDVCQELVDVFEPTYFNLGLDEIDIPSRPQTFCVCPRCRDADGGELFANHILALYAPLKAQGIEVMMWADMLMYRPEHNTTNGVRSGTWKAIERLPRDLIMLDWVYFPVADYGGAQYLRSHGFPVMGGTWFHPRALAEYARFAARHELWGMVATTWAVPTPETLPMISVLMAGKLFVQPEADPDSAEQVALAFARRLAGARR